MDKMDKMKCILVGYPGSQSIVPASRYLVEKYLPFEFHWLNWLEDTRGWSRFIATYFAHLDDELVILTLDDYLVNGFNKKAYENLKSQVKGNVVCAKLHDTTEEEHKGYPVTTQYTIWNREFLIELLSHTTTPWDFEINGSNIFSRLNVKSIYGSPAVTYNTSSALSGRWKGVDWKGVKEEDLKIIKPLCEKL